MLDVNLANSVDRSIVDACFPSPSMQVNAVETRVQARQREMEEQQLAKETAEEKADVKLAEELGDQVQRNGLETLVCNTEEEIGDSADEKEEQVEDISEGKKDEVGEQILGRGEALVAVEEIEKSASDCEKRQKDGEVMDFNSCVNNVYACIPDIDDGKDFELFSRELLDDRSLEKLRLLPDQNMRGYLWRDKILYH